MPTYDLPGVEALREMAEDDAGSIFAQKSELDAYRPVFLDRELSWLAFDHRVMLEAAERALPLYERLRFLAIYASNMDEFYMVRVGGLVDQDQLHPFRTDSVSDLTPREQLIIIRRFGLDRNYPPMTLKQVGEELGVTKERIRQIEILVIGKLREKNPVIPD